MGTAQPLHQGCLVSEAPHFPAEHPFPGSSCRSPFNGAPRTRTAFAPVPRSVHAHFYDEGTSLREREPEQGCRGFQDACCRFIRGILCTGWGQRKGSTGHGTGRKAACKRRGFSAGSSQLTGTAKLAGPSLAFPRLSVSSPLGRVTRRSFFKNLAPSPQSLLC